MGEQQGHQSQTLTLKPGPNSNHSPYPNTSTNPAMSPIFTQACEVHSSRV